MTTLTIKDLSAQLELDGKAMFAVRGGQDNQANGASQLNGLNLMALNNVGVGLTSAGPLTVQSDVANTQYAHNDAWLSNDAYSSFGFVFPVMR